MFATSPKLLGQLIVNLIGKCTKKNAVPKFLMEVHVWFLDLDCSVEMKIGSNKSQWEHVHSKRGILSLNVWRHTSNDSAPPSSNLGCMTDFDMRLRLTFVIRLPAVYCFQKTSCAKDLKGEWNIYTYKHLSCIYYLNLIDYHISYCIAIIVV
jgi:hypothetical protein